MKRFLLPVLTGFVLLLLLSTSVSARDPIKIGFSMALTGGLAGGGKQALVGMELWADDINAKGGILGRPVKLIYYDDQTRASTVPGIYAKLLDVDKVDFVVSGYGTNLIAPAMPLVKQRDIVFMGLFGMDNNKKWKHDKYFQILPSGPDPIVDFSRAWFETIMQLNPKPKSIAFVGADAEFARNLKEGAVTHARGLGLKITYNKNYKPGTPDFTPIMRAINATNPDVIYVAAYPPGAAGMTRAVSEVGTKAVAFGGGMVGLQFSGIMKTLGPKLNGILNYDFYVPERNMTLYPGVVDLLKRYQKIAPARRVDPKGWYLAPWSYAYLQVLGDAVNAVGKIDHDAIAKYIHATEFTTVVGKVRFGKNGEWLKGRTLTVQWQNIKKEGDLEQFAQPGIRKIMAPAAFATGKVQPFNSLRGEFALAAGRAIEDPRENRKLKYANKHSSSYEGKLRLLEKLEKKSLITKEEAAGKRNKLERLRRESTRLKDEKKQKPKPKIIARKTPTLKPVQRVAKRPDDVAVIIANSNYTKQGKGIPNVKPAYTDAKNIKRYFMESLGVREGNIIYLKDATKAQMTSVLGSNDDHRGKLFNWTKRNVSKVYVYYAGHGAPAGDKGTTYLVPSDTDSETVQLTAYPLKQLYSNLGKIPATYITVILEACFSGNSQGGNLLVNTSGISVVPRMPSTPKRITVISAGAANQVASWEKDKSQSLFTKYFLKGMSGEGDRKPYGNSDGKVSLRELKKYLDGNMTYYARRYYGRTQQAQIVVNGKELSPTN